MRENTFFEQLSKFILESLFPDKYYDLEIKDSPDLVLNPLLGIEVTRAVNRSILEMSKNYYKYHSLSKETLKIANTSKIPKNIEFLYYKDRVGGFTTNDNGLETLNELKQSVKQKIAKRDNYKTKEVHLFIISQMAGLYTDQEIKDFHTWCVEKSCFTYYPIVYVYQLDCLYQLTKNSTFNFNEYHTHSLIDLTKSFFNSYNKQ